MEQKLISKKELLDLYEISYGALYRWKRKGLIPEDWFIKKATVTGQETFFPRELICQRISLIKSQKDEHSLDALSQQFSSETKKTASIVVETVYGIKVFYLNEIRSVTVQKADGSTLDLTKEIIGGKL